MPERSARLAALIEAEPDLDFDVLLDRLRMEPPEVYRLLLSLAGDPRVCAGGRYRINTFDGPLTVAVVQKLAAEAEGSRRDIARAARLAKILGLLNERTPHGGLKMREIAALCGVGERQVYRDLRTIEDDMGIPLEREGRPLRYRLKTAYLPPLGPDQALIIFLSLLQQRGSALAGHINTIKNVLVTHLFKNRYRAEDFPVTRLQSRLHFVEEAVADPETVAGVFARITEALQKEIRLKIRYFVGYRGELTERVIEPYALICKRQNWYLVGYCAQSEDVRTFRVDQIENAVLRSDERFIYPEDFSVQDYVGSAWGVMNIGPPRQVLLRFKPAVAYRLRRTIYHPSQSIEEEAGDGSIVVSFRISGLAEFCNWLLQWQDWVEVLEPASLRDEMAAIGRKIAGLYAEN